MVFTLSDCIERINQALDYPAVEYADISHYFDQAISELNSTLRIGIRPISYILKHYKADIYRAGNIIALSEAETYTNIPVLTEDPESGNCYYNSDTKLFGIRKSGVFEYYEDVYGYIPDNSTLDVKTFKAVYFSESSVCWTTYNTDPINTLDLTEWLPMDVLILFVIPYVCNKYMLRSGGIGSVFREEFVQGFQQIQTSYDIPNFVNLVSVAGKKAYSEDVELHIKDMQLFNITVPTRAIYDDMKIGNAIQPEYGGMYDGGGWGF